MLKENMLTLNNAVKCLPNIIIVNGATSGVFSPDCEAISDGSSKHIYPYPKPCHRIDLAYESVNAPTDTITNDGLYRSPKSPSPSGSKPECILHIQTEYKPTEIGPYKRSVAIPQPLSPNGPDPHFTRNISNWHTPNKIIPHDKMVPYRQTIPHNGSESNAHTKAEHYATETTSDDEFVLNPQSSNGSDHEYIPVIQTDSLTEFVPYPEIVTSLENNTSLEQLPSTRRDPDTYISNELSQITTGDGVIDQSSSLSNQYNHTSALYSAVLANGTKIDIKSHETDTHFNNMSIPTMITDRNIVPKRASLTSKNNRTVTFESIHKELAQGYEDDGEFEQFVNKRTKSYYIGGFKPNVTEIIVSKYIERRGPKVTKVLISRNRRYGNVIVRVIVEDNEYADNITDDPSFWPRGINCRPWIPYNANKLRRPGHRQDRHNSARDNQYARQQCYNQYENENEYDFEHENRYTVLNTSAGVD